MRYFFYGSLLDSDVAALVVGRRLPPRAWVPATLPGFSRRKAKGVSYPIAVRDPKGTVRGAVVGGLSKREVERLAAFEGPGYHTVPVKVRMDGRLTVVSVFAPKEKAFQPIESDWSLTEWQHREKKKFVEQIRKTIKTHPTFSRD